MENDAGLLLWSVIMMHAWLNVKHSEVKYRVEIFHNHQTLFVTSTSNLLNGYVSEWICLNAPINNKHQ